MFNQQMMWSIQTHTQTKQRAQLVGSVDGTAHLELMLSGTGCIEKKDVKWTLHKFIIRINFSTFNNWI